MKNTLLAAVPDLSGPIWLTAQNKPCKVWNPYPEAGETLTWSGDCVDGKASGWGRNVWRGSYGESVYEGECRNGKRHGRGALLRANGQTYEGEWRADKMHGQGTCTDPEAEHSGTVYSHRYKGGWREEKWHGLGVRTQSIMYNVEDRPFVTHHRFEGEFREGKLHGKGTAGKGDTFGNVDKTAAWSRYEGEWRVRYEGEWRNGEAHGQWTYIETDGSRLEGEWRNGELYFNGIGGKGRRIETFIDFRVS